VLNILPSWPNVIRRPTNPEGVVYFLEFSGNRWTLVADLFLSPSKVCWFLLYTSYFKLRTDGSHTTLNQGNVGAKDGAELGRHVSSFALFSNGYVNLAAGDNRLALWIIGFVACECIFVLQWRHSISECNRLTASTKFCMDNQTATTATTKDDGSSCWRTKNKTSASKSINNFRRRTPERKRLLPLLCWVEGNIFSTCCSTGNFMLGFLNVIITANLFLASFADW